MYLSRLILNPRHRGVSRDLSNCHALHRTVLSAFPPTPAEDQSARMKFAVLHRVDVLPRTGRIELLVQSIDAPDWSKLPPGYLLEAEGELANPAVKDVGSLFDQITLDTVLAFRLRANPTKKKDSSSKADRLAGKPKKNGARVPLIRDENLIGWLQRKGTEGGFALEKVRISKGVPDVIASPEGAVTGRKTGSGLAVDEKNKLTFRSILFEGHLRVTNRDQFLETLQRGIGSGKAYGFGLLSIAPAR